MSYIETSPIKNSTIMLLYSERSEIKLDPPYQRMGGVWTKEKKQLLIDSILNDYDLPKIYFHTYSREQSSLTGISYAVIDGRQRLETIWGFIDGDFTLSDDFEYQRDPGIDLSGLSYDDIAKEYPRIKIKFDSFVLPVIAVDTDDEDLIEDMFYRLNEAVPLNAAEKRNAIGGEMVHAIRDLAEHDLFKEKVKFSNKRYQHREVAARFLLLEENLRFEKTLMDTKKVYLDAMARNYYSGQSDRVNEMLEAAKRVVDKMYDVFTSSDELLRAQGNMTVYFLIFRYAVERGLDSEITRRKLIDFNEKLKANRLTAIEDYENSSFDLLEYDRLTQQGTNDASNIKERLSILSEFVGIGEVKI
ncbi:DUF262 domain-containing protein [Halomonas almeriensis]|uniref:DUF262 domain-containing protein n=1 Tax=Halomonas almeriensis TaxID=308163 RepID=UPI0025B3CA89|nr:DUF262 domain-containing protein [Halomonas almeriensis]MDN3553763.1 DUF262 domain-containing protein [Halomonas almeriensis]